MIATPIVVKMADTTTNITYDVLTGAGGDSTPAVFRYNGNTNTPLGLRAQLRVVTQWNGPKTARQLKFNFFYPHLMFDNNTSTYMSKDRVLIEGLVVIPQGIPTFSIAEAAHQGLNLLASSAIKEAAITGYSPT